MEFDPIDHQILSILRLEGRVSNAELARRVGLTAAPTHERVRRLEQNGVIRGYSARIDPPAVGLGLVVFVSISLAMHQLAAIEGFRDAVRALPEVVECHHLTGDADFLLKVMVADMAAFERVLRERLIRLPGVQRIQSSVVLATMKDEPPPPLDHQTS